MKLSYIKNYYPYPDEGRFDLGAVFSYRLRWVAGLRIGRDGRFDQSEAYDGSWLVGERGLLGAGGGIFRLPFYLII